MELPKTSPGTYTLLRAEVATGIILNFDDTRYSCEEDYSPHKFFDSLQELKIFIELDKKFSSIAAEYLIYDHTGEFLEYIS